MSEVPPGYSNYYRPQPTGPAPAKEAKVRLEYIGEAFNIVTKDLGTWIPATILLFVITYAVSLPLSLLANALAYGTPFPVNPPAERQMFASLYSIFLGIPGNLLNFILLAGMYNLAVNKVEGRPADFTQMFSGFSRLGPLVVGFFLMYLSIAVGMVLCILPGLYVVGVLALYPIMLIRQDQSAVELYSTAWGVFKKHGVAFFALLFLLGLIMMLGIVACCVGFLVAFPVYIVTLAMHYRDFFPSQPEPVFQQPMGPQGPGMQI
jgi:hypothetical protein